MHSYTIQEADLGRPGHQSAVLRLLDSYSSDPMGDGQPLTDEVKSSLLAGLQNHPTTLIFLAFDGAEAIGIAVCFIGFSTFAARPLINVHDLAVLPEHRGNGAGRKLLEEVEGKARKIGCCKLTLEVQENNQRARKIYEAFGFSQAQYQPDAGPSLFMSKPFAALRS